MTTYDLDEYGYEALRAGASGSDVTEGKDVHGVLRVLCRVVTCSGSARLVRSCDEKRGAAGGQE